MKTTRSLKGFAWVPRSVPNPGKESPRLAAQAPILRNGYTPVHHPAPADAPTVRMAFSTASDPTNAVVSCTYG